MAAPRRQSPAPHQPPAPLPLPTERGIQCVATHSCRLHLPTHRDHPTRASTMAINGRLPTDLAHRLTAPPPLPPPPYKRPSSLPLPAPPPRPLLARAAARDRSSAAAGAPPQAADVDLLSRRLSLLSEASGEFLLSSSCFWSISRRVWCLGGRFCHPPAIPGEPAARRRRAPFGPRAPRTRRRLPPLDLHLTV
jgi:hypothetical protein